MTPEEKVEEATEEKVEVERTPSPPRVQEQDIVERPVSVKKQPSQVGERS